MSARFKLKSPTASQRRACQLRQTKLAIAHVIDWRGLAKGLGCCKLERKRTCAAALHHLIVALPVGGDENDLSAEAVPHLLEQFDRVWPSSSLLRVPEDHPLGRDVLVDEARDGRSECLFLVGTDPDEEPEDKRRQKNETVRFVSFKQDLPIWALDTGGKRRPDTGSGANANASLKHGGSVPDAGYSVLVDRCSLPV